MLTNNNCANITCVFSKRALNWYIFVCCRLIFLLSSVKFPPKSISPVLCICLSTCSVSLSLPLLQEFDISWTPGQRRKWLFVWSVKLKGNDDNLPSVSVTHICPLMLPPVCLPFYLSARLSLISVSFNSVPGSSCIAAGTEDLSEVGLPRISALAVE